MSLDHLLHALYVALVRALDSTSCVCVCGLFIPSKAKFHGIQVSIGQVFITQLFLQFCTLKVCMCVSINKMS